MTDLSVELDLVPPTGKWSNPLWRPRIILSIKNNVVEQLHLIRSNLEKETFTFALGVNSKAPWSYDLKYHVKMFKKLQEIFPHKYVIISYISYVFPMIGEPMMGEGDKKEYNEFFCLILKYINDNRINNRDNNIFKKMSSDVVEVNGFIRYLIKLCDGLDYKRKISFPKLRYYITFCNPFPEEKCFYLEYDNDHGLVIETPTLITIDNIKATVEKSKVDKPLVLALELIQLQEFYTDIYKLIKSNIQHL